MKGEAKVEITLSTACVNASIAVAASRPPGRFATSSGSSSACDGATRAPPMTTLRRWAWSVITVNCVTSLPVPVVVGMAIRAGSGLDDLAEADVVQEFPRIRRQDTDSFGRVHRAAAAYGDQPLAALRVVGVQCPVDRLKAGVGLDRVKN